jgi:hypothetical protein
VTIGFFVIWLLPAFALSIWTILTILPGRQ